MQAFVGLLLMLLAALAGGFMLGVAWERWRLTRLVRNYFPVRTPLKSKPSFDDTDLGRQWKHLDLDVATKR